MGLQDWLKWLTNEAISNYIVFILGIFIGVVGWLVAQRLTRKKPSIVRVQKEFESELIDIDSKVRDKLQIVYDGHSIGELHQAIFTINNTGDVPIEDVIITFHLEGFEEADFIEVVLTNPEEIQELKVQPLESDFDSFTIHLPFLNPRKQYEDVLV